MNDVDVSMRLACLDDVETMVSLLAADPLGSQREQAGVEIPQAYFDAFAAICSDPNHELIIAVAGSTVVGMMQLSFLPYLTYRGGWRAQIEGVRVAEQARGAGVGAEMIRWAVDRAKERGCHLVQLTTDKTRSDAIRFYESLGFKSTHEGMKLHLVPAV